MNKSPVVESTTKITNDDDSIIIIHHRVGAFINEKQILDLAKLLSNPKVVNGGFFDDINQDDIYQIGPNEYCYLGICFIQNIDNSSWVLEKLMDKLKAKINC